MARLRDDIDVLHVDDDGQFAELSATFVERHAGGIAVETATEPEEALSLVENQPFDCIVSDYQMPRMDGLELFETLRSRGVDVPFVLFTGKGSEEIASEAISLGVTEYLQKETGTEQYEVLANRIRNVVAHHRAETRLQRGYRALDAAPVGVVVADVRAGGRVVYANAAFQEYIDCGATELLGRDCASLLSNGASTRPVRRLWEAIEEGQPVSDELVPYRENGTEQTVHLRVEPVGRDDGEMTHFAGFLVTADRLPDGTTRAQPVGFDPTEL